MNKKLVKNYIYTVLYQLIQALVPIITISYKTKVFSPETMGIYSYIFTVSSYIIMLGSIGISVYGQREIAYVKDDPEKRTKILYELILLKTIVLTFVTILFFLIFGLRSIYRNYYIILLIQILISIFDVTWFMQGIEEFKKISIVNSITKIINVICLFLFIKTNNDLLKYIILTIIFYIIPYIVIFIMSIKYTKKINKEKINSFRHLKNCLILFIPQIFIQIYTVCDKIMLGNFQNNISEVGYYEYADKIIQIAMGFIGALTTIMIPIISYQYKKKENNKLKSNINDLTNIVALLSLPMTFGMLALSNNVVEVFFNSSYDKVNILLKILSLSIFPMSFTGVGGQYLISTKKEMKYTTLAGIGMCINLVLNLLLIKNYASVGVAITTIVTESIIAIMNIPIIGKLINKKETIINISKYLLFSIIMFIVVYLIGTIKSNIIILGLQGIIGLLLYFVLLLITKDKLLLKLLKSKN